jgi:hypothetical protein
MRRTVFLALALVVVAATAVGVTAAVTRTADSTGVSRVERVMLVDWGSQCGSDFCFIVPAGIPYTTPVAPQAVDITVTITLSYRTTRGDPASVQLLIDDGTEGDEWMRPRSFPLRPTTTRTTTTLTWLKKDVPAAGKAYTFQFFAKPRHALENARVSGKRLIVVIESWTAGD